MAFSTGRESQPSEKHPWILGLKTVVAGVTDNDLPVEGRERG